MKFIIQKIGCAAVLAALMLGAMTGGVMSLFDGNGAASSLPTFPVVSVVTPNGVTDDADLPDGVQNPDIDINFDTEFEGDSDPLGLLGFDKLLGGMIPGQGIQSGNQGGGSSGGSSSGGGSTTPITPNTGNVGTVVTPPMVTNSGLAFTIKSHTYSSGLDIFQSSRNDIPTDTAALMNAINQGYNKCSFIAVRISDGATIAYNANAIYRCASSYKAFASLYTFKQAEAGVYNLSTPLTYTSADYYSGSGIIKSSPFGTVYSLKTVADYSIRYSDNAAYTMLQRYLNKNQLVAYGASLGCPNYAGYKNSWPDVSAIDAALWWAEIYNFASSSSYGQQLYEVFLSATHPAIKKALGNEYAVAHKSGSMSYYYHDAGIVHSEDPYLLVVLTHNPYNYSSNNDSYFAPLVQQIDKLINP